MTLIETIHGNFVHERRTRALSKHFAELLPVGARVLDIGCGDGLFAALIARQRPDLTVQGIDVAVRPQTHIPVVPFDGRTIPYPDRSFDAVMFVDVLHHTDDPLVLLREAGRVTSSAVLIKDHTLDGLLAGRRLRFMDRVGNARHGVDLPYNYWPRSRWLEAFTALGWTVEAWRTSLGLYFWPASLVFERSLHFVALLKVNGSGTPHAA